MPLEYSAGQKIFSIASPNGRLSVDFNGVGDILRFYEKLPEGGTIDYFYGPIDNRNPMLHPWSNRVAGGEFSFNGQTHLLRPLHGAENNALHGKWLAPWRVTEIGDHHFVLDIECRAEDSQDCQTPYEHSARQIFTLENSALDVQMEVVNHGTTLPFGIGLHPFLPRPQDTIVTMEAPRMENCGPDMIPDKETPVIATPDSLDFSRGLTISNETLGPAQYGFRNADLLDNCFPGVDPKKGVVITWPSFGENGRQMNITASNNCSYAVCFVPGAENDKRAGEMSFFCMELVTNGIDMQNRMDRGDRDTGGVILARGERIAATTRYAIHSL
jgi:aldose 1-epimerase